MVACYQKGVNNMNKKTIPIFFTCDDAYAPFLAVALESLEQNASRRYNYHIRVLHANSLNATNQAKIKQKYHGGNFIIECVDVTEVVKAFTSKFHVRDYYSQTIYYRLFIASLFPQYDKVLYLDSDIVVLGDISRLYRYRLGKNLLGAVTEEFVQTVPDLQKYTEQHLGLADSKQYFNSGILVMNLRRLREINFEKIFLGLVDKVAFYVAPDQDYLNVICRNQVRYLPGVWNKEPILKPWIKDKDVKLLHYAVDKKPWHKRGLLYENYFWQYAKQTDFYDEIVQHLANFTPEQLAEAEQQTVNLVAKAKAEAEDVAENQRIAQVVREVCPD